MSSINNSNNNNNNNNNNNMDVTSALLTAERDLPELDVFPLPTESTTESQGAFKNVSAT